MPSRCFVSSVISRTLQPLLLILGCIDISAQTCVVTDREQFPSQGGSSSTALTVLALGTSVMWGNGLRPEHTFRYQVAQWLQFKTHRPINLVTLAHSSAFLNDHPGGASSPDPQNGALNGNYPSVQEQGRCAAQHLGLIPELVLVEGCINDVNATSIVTPWTDTTQIIESTDKFCGDEMLTLLRE